MNRPKPLPICDDATGRHVWIDPFSDGDTCVCGRFYLDLHTVSGFVAEVTEAPAPADDAAAEPA